MARRSLLFYGSSYLRLAQVFRNGIEMAIQHNRRADCDHATLWSGETLHSPPGRGGLVETVVEIWASEVYRGGTFYEPRSEHVVLDIGANIGIFSSWLSHHAKGIRVLAFEPFGENVSQLRANMRPWPNVEIYACAVGGQHGTAKMIPIGGRSVDHQLDAMASGEVSVITLAEVMDLAACDVDLLKMDIEGSEYEVFAASQPMELMRKINKIVIEWHEHIKPGVLDLLRSRLAPTHDIVSVTDDTPSYGMLYAVRRAAN